MINKQLLDDYAKIQEQIKGLLKDAEVKAREIMDAGFKDIFGRYPDLKEISWTQYTPWFNDGDECVFGVNEPYIKFLSDDEGRDEYDLEGEMQGEAYEEVSTFLSTFKDEDMQRVFGDHVTVVVTRDGIETDGYDHD